MFFRNMEIIYVEKIQSNDLLLLEAEKIELGRQLADAFQRKNVEEIRQFVNLGAPVNYRLDYGLEIIRESDFVAAFYLLLEGDKGKEQLFANALKLVSDEVKAIELVNYIKDSLEIFTILRQQNADAQEIKININFLNLIKKYAVTCRANPQHANGSLIVAAGLRNKEFASQIISRGKSAMNKSTNGADVNFKGYFDDNAAVWSAILLDKDTLELLLDNGSDIHEIGISKSSLLHWVALVYRLGDDPQRQAKASTIAEMLLQRGAKLDTQNILGKTPMDYAKGELRELFSKLNLENNNICFNRC